MLVMQIFKVRAIQAVVLNLQRLIICRPPLMHLDFQPRCKTQVSRIYRVREVVDSASVKNLQGQGNLDSMTGSTSVDQVHIGSAHHGLGNVRDVTLNGVSASATKDSYQS